MKLIEKIFGCKHIFISIKSKKEFYLVDKKGKRTKKPIVTIRKEECSKCGRRKKAIDFTYKSLFE